MKNQTHKIQKIIAGLGLGSRRQVETWIEEGLITIDDELAKLGDRITGHEKIKIDGQLVEPPEQPPETRVIMYHKAVGEVCTRSDPEGRPTIFDHLPEVKDGRWIVVGRLDLNTSGLLLFTNNGLLANTLMHPSGGFEREYAVRVFGRLSDGMKNNLLKGVRLSDGLAKFSSIEDAGGEGSNRWYHVILTEGRNREVRRMFEAAGLKINRLIRIRFGKTKLPVELNAQSCIEFNEKNIRKMLATIV